MTQPAPQQPLPNEVAAAAAAEPVAYESYPFQVQDQVQPSTGMVPYSAPMHDAPDAVEVGVRPGIRSYGWTLLTVVMGTLALLNAHVFLSDGDWRGYAILAIAILAIPMRLGMTLFPTRVRVDAEGMVIKPRTFGVPRPWIKVSWQDVSSVILRTRVEGSGKSARRVTRLTWYAKPSSKTAVLHGTSGGFELGDVNDDRLAAVLAKYGPPNLKVDDNTILGF